MLAEFDGGRVGVVSVDKVIKVDGELWLLYSAVIQSAERATFEIRTSSMLPL